MRKILFAVATLTPFWTLGQSILKSSNPAPRVGDEIIITIELQDAGQQVASGSLAIQEVLIKEGPAIFGPFTFKIGEKTYETATLTINVSPKLPNNVKDGIWMRSVESGGSQYLIIEQRISSEWTAEKKSGNETTISFGGNVKYAEFKKEVLTDNGIDIPSSSSSSGSQPLEGYDAFKGTVNYQIQIFELKKTGKFTKKIKIDKKAFKDFPNRVEVEELWIE
jgi:hypothetical protein